MSSTGISYYYVLSGSGEVVSRHRTVTAAAKRIVRDGAVGRWSIVVDLPHGRIPIFGGDLNEAERILYPAIFKDDEEAS